MHYLTWWKAEAPATTGSFPPPTMPAAAAILSEVLNKYCCCCCCWCRAFKYDWWWCISDKLSRKDVDLDGTAVGAAPFAMNMLMASPYGLLLAARAAMSGNLDMTGS